MISTELCYELNHTYVALSGDGVKIEEDYRHKMLISNIIPGTLKPQYRQINNEKRMIFDISDKESLLNYFVSRTFTRQEVKSLFEAIYLVSTTLSKYLLEEGNILIRPDLIFKDVRNGKYEFICVPVKEEETEGKESIKNLLSFLITHLDNEDESLVRNVYGLYDMQEYGRLRYTTLYESTVKSLKDNRDIVDEMLDEAAKQYEELKANEPAIEDSKTALIKKKFERLFPTRKEIIVLCISVIGMLLIGLYLYINML